MALTFTNTSLPGIFIIEPDRFKDARGSFMETYHQRKYATGGMDRVFVQDNCSHSIKGTLRGLHYQLRKPQAKLVHVIAGEIFDVAADIRIGSPAFGKWVGTHLSGESGRQIFIPEGFAHGFCVLSDEADVLYKVTEFYIPDDEYGILWSDPMLDIRWPLEKPLLSQRDREAPRLREIPEDRLPVYDV